MRLILLPILVMTLTIAAGALRADEPLVFISAFTSGEKAAIQSYQFDTQTGDLKPLQRTTDIQNPFFLALSPDHRFLYSIDAEKFGGKKEEFVAAFAIEGRTGQLRRLNRQSSHGTAACYLDVDASGKTVVVANYSSGTVAALPVQSDGSLGEAASVIQHAASDTDADHKKPPHAHSIVVSPDQHFALAADLGLDRIFTYRLDPAAAGLTSKDAPAPAVAAPGSGPRHMVFHPNGKSVYVINETKNTVTFFDFSATSGALTERQTISTLPPDFTGKSYCADLKITPDGHFLYGTNRGHDSIAIFRIADDGMLTAQGTEPSRGKGPQNLLITPDGRWLFCANMAGGNVILFLIDGATGKLSAAGEPLMIPSPSCIRLLP